MKKNLFEMGAKFEEGWSSNNKIKTQKTKIQTKEPNKHQLYITKEKRRGKTVTIIKPFYIEKKSLKTILKILKSQLGCGGTVKENSIELQGDISQKAKEIILNLGYRFKK